MVKLKFLNILHIICNHDLRFFKLALLQLLQDFPRDLVSLKRAQILCFYMGQPDLSLKLVEQVFTEVVVEEISCDFFARYDFEMTFKFSDNNSKIILLRIMTTVSETDQ